MADAAEELDELEESDIYALARASLKPGEVILGEGHEDAPVESRGICLKPLILQKEQDISYKVPEGAKRVPWVDSLAIEGREPLPKGLKAKDGSKLEAAFSSQALESVREAFRRLKVMRVPFNRPSDFYAEMLRTDSQMYRVRSVASEEQRRMKIVEDRKKAQAAKKFQKKARSKKLEARASEKKQTLESIAKWQAQQKRDKQNADDQNLEDILSKQALKQKQQDKGKGGKDGKGDGKGGNARAKRKVSRKQAAKDKKYGFGGKKSASKRNDARSARDESGAPWAKKGKGKGKGGGGPGKGKGKGKGGPQPGGMMSKKRKR